MGGWLDGICGFPPMSSAGADAMNGALRLGRENLEGGATCLMGGWPAHEAAMITGYFDESGGESDGFVVVAGFVGRVDDWKKYLKMWRRELGNRPSLHLKEMRLGSESGARRYGDLLRRLGSVPSKAGLLPFVGSVSLAHTAKAKGTIAEIALAGYNVALVAMVDAILGSKRLPKRERIEFTFEDQVHFAIPRASMFHSYRQVEKYKTCPGKRSRIGKDSSMAKDPLLEASDYLAYAMLQHLIDPASGKATVTAPILESTKAFMNHNEITKENVDHLLEIVFGEEIPAMDWNKRIFFLEEMRKSLKK